METHPIQETPRRWITALMLALLAVGIHTTLLMIYAGAEWLPALTDGLSAVVLFTVLAYLSWYVTGFVSMLQTDIVVSVLALLFWLAGGFAVQEWIGILEESTYAPFIVTFPFRALFGLLGWTVVMLWYKLQIQKQSCSEKEESEEEQEPLIPGESVLQTESNKQLSEEPIDRITIKDGSRIHLISIDSLLYVQACGDYVTLVTPDGQYVKETTMKYLECHLPASGFVRIHRSTIVNVTQISRVELFGKENYRLLLKNGDKLRVSLSGYKLLKTRLSL